MIDQHLSGREVRGIMENINDLGSEYNILNNAGIQCVAHSLSGDFHHKYGVFDVNDTDPQVVTGSHNWSFSAEAFNDENTLVIHDFRIASLYRSEFEKRWQELTVPVSTLKKTDSVFGPIRRLTDCISGLPNRFQTFM
jgi:phosphatidylserine/phosphatidylglycerophosphate/cardiolipin synthase-like enzyme